MQTARLLTASLLILFLLGGCAASQKTAETKPDATASADEKPDKDEDEMKAYKDIITDKAVSDDGLFTVHEVDDKLYYEMADSLLDREMLMVSRIAATANNIGYGGMKTNTQVLRWQRHKNNILLRIVSHENVADEDQPIYQAVRNSNFEPIIRSFKIEALNEDSTGSVIEAVSYTHL